MDLELILKNIQAIQQEILKLSKNDDFISFCNDINLIIYDNNTNKIVIFTFSDPNSIINSNDYSFCHLNVKLTANKILRDHTFIFRFDSKEIIKELDIIEFYKIHIQSLLK
jgi:hypothetical protein